MKHAKLNCWQDLCCGREPGGAYADQLGVCPAAADESCDGANEGTNGGRICWAIPGTLCKGKVQGTYWEKEPTCRACPFFRRVRCEEVSHFQLLKPGLGINDVQGVRQSHNRGFPALLNLCRDIFASLAPKALLARVTGIALELTGADSVGAYLLEADSGGLRLEAIAGKPLLPASIAQDEDSLARKALSDHYVCRGDLDTTGSVQGLAVPVGGQPEPAGVLVMARTDGEFSTDDAWLLWELAMLTGLGIGSSKLIEMTNSLRELDRIKSRHVALLLHQIGSPMATIACSLQAVLKTSAHLETEDRELLEACMARVRSITTLSQRLLDLGAIRAGRRLADIKPVRVADVLVGEVRSRQLQADRAGLQIVTDVGDGNGLIEADTEGLRLIFANLIDNAIKYSADRGKTIHVSLGSAAGDLHVTVRDEGIGIPPESRDRLFEEFHRANNAWDSKVRGFGLGLAFVRELVTRYDGRIDVESELDVGTAFTVTFPLVSSGRPEKTDREGIHES